MKFDQVVQETRVGQHFRGASWPEGHYWFKSDPSGSYHGQFVDSNRRVIYDVPQDDREGDDWEAQLV
jgi:hypothetical protein